MLPVPLQFNPRARAAVAASRPPLLHCASHHLITRTTLCARRQLCILPRTGIPDASNHTPATQRIAPYRPSTPPLLTHTQGVSVTVPIFPEPPIEVTLELDYVAYSQDASMLLLPLSRTWKYGGSGTGIFDTGATFESNMLLGGTATLSLGIKTPSGKSVATVNLAGEVGIGISEWGLEASGLEVMLVGGRGRGRGRTTTALHAFLFFCTAGLHGTWAVWCAGHEGHSPQRPRSRCY